jgi:hypothetical protein
MERAANQGYAKALSKLGDMYLNGDGVTQDAGKARELYLRAGSPTE